MQHYSFDTSLSEDMIEGANAIAKFVFGKEDVKSRRKIYHMAEHGGLPTIKIGVKLFARKSTIMKWLSEKEQKAA